MGFMDMVKTTTNNIKDKAVNFAEDKKLGEKFANVKDGVKKAVSDGSANMKAYKEESKALKQPLEGAYIRYEVTYVMGLDDIPKAKAGAIGFNVMPDRFAFRVTIGSEDWFYDFDILYEQVTDIYIDKRTITTAEVFLGGGDSANQEQENVIVIEYTDEAGVNQTLRVEMLTGVTIFNQAAKCKEFMALLRKQNLLDKLQKKTADSATPQVDVVAQIEKLSKLMETGVISEEEFAEKKKELLAKL